MMTARQITHDLYPVLRQAGWRRWLVVAALVCTVGIYSIELTHDHKTTVAEMACPVCHVMAHGAPTLLKPNLVPTVSFGGWYRHVVLRPESSVLPVRFNLKPQPRAPPVISPPLV